MKKKMMKRLVSWFVAAAMVVAMLPVSVLGAPVEAVAKIGDTEYTTLDEAVEKADEGATIELLTDCELTKGFNKTLTFTGNGTIHINQQLQTAGEQWMIYTKTLTLDGSGVKLIWDSREWQTPEIEAQSPSKWLLMSLSGTINVKNGASLYFYVDSKNGAGTYGKYNASTGETDTIRVHPNCAIYMNADSSINVDNGSNFSIYGIGTTGITGQALQMDSPNTVNISVTGNSNFLIDGTNRGYVNSPSIYVEDSTFTVQNCTANASNGGNFTAVNSQIFYKDNAGHGLSADDVIIKNSNFVASNNGYYGMRSAGEFKVDSTSKVVVTGNSAGGDFAGLKLTSGVTAGKVESGAVVTITDNYCSGLSNNGKCVFEEGAKLTIMNNNNDKGASSHGGGVYNSGDNANLTLPSDAVIYNNHSKTDGDDIFNNTTATITFGKVGSDWVLDDCEHLIDGWYQDGEGTRWQVCDLAEGETTYAEEYVLENATATVTGLKALKAAHGYDPKDKVSYPGLDKQVKDDDEGWDDDVDAAAGQEVNFQLTSNVPTDLTNYLNPEDVYPPVIGEAEPGKAGAVAVEGRGSYVLTFHDKLNAMLTNPTNYKVQIGETALSAGQYTLTTTGLEDGCSFEIAIDLAALYEAGVITDDNIKNATPITVTYDATLSADATAGSYENTAWVTAPNDWETSKDIVSVNTYAIDIFKYDQADNTGLAGAEFELYQKDTEGNVIEGSKVTLTSGEDGKILVDGLDAGTYYLKETKAPEGYVCSSAELTIVIPGSADADNTVSVRFANSQIPHTGGSGTLMFTIGGAMLMATAGLLLAVSRKKKRA